MKVFRTLNTNERAWLEESRRRYKELVDGTVKGVPGDDVFERLRARLAQSQSEKS